MGACVVVVAVRQVAVVDLAVGSAAGDLAAVAPVAGGDVTKGVRLIFLRISSLTLKYPRKKLNDIDRLQARCDQDCCSGTDPKNDS